MAMVSQIMGSDRRAMDEWPGRRRNARQDAQESLGITSRNDRILIGILIVLAIALFGRIMAYPLQHDEQLFMTSGILLSDSSLYRDLGYNHLPNYVWLLNGLFRTTGTDHFLLMARLFEFLLWGAAAWAFWLIGTRIAGSRTIALSAIILLVTNITMLGSPGVLATNNFAPLPLALFGFYLFYQGVESVPLRPGMIAFAGFCLAIAAGFKANYLFVIPPFVIAALLVPRGLSFPRRIAAVLVPLGLGGFVGALPVLYYLLTDAAGFFAHTLDYFTTLHVAYWKDLDVPKVMSIPGKVQLAESVWLGGTMLLSAAGALIFTLVPLLRNTERRHYPGWPFWVALGLIAGGVAVSFVPTPSFHHYYVPPIIFVILLFVLAYGALPETLARTATPVIIALTLLGLVSGASRLLPSLIEIARPATWTGVRIHRTGQEIGRIASAHGDRIATLAPLYALEGGMKIYPELNAGPFIYRVADRISDAQRPYYRAVTATGLAAMLDNHPPAAILTGLEGELDDAFTRYAMERGYIAREFEGQKEDEGPLTLYVRPDSSAR